MLKSSDNGKTSLEKKYVQIGCTFFHIFSTSQNKTSFAHCSEHQRSVCLCHTHCQGVLSDVLELCLCVCESVSLCLCQCSVCLCGNLTCEKPFPSEASAPHCTLQSSTHLTFQILPILRIQSLIHLVQPIASLANLENLSG